MVVTNHFFIATPTARILRLIAYLEVHKKPLFTHQPRNMRYRFILSLLLASFLLKGCQPVEEKITKEEAVQFASELEANAIKRKEGFLSSNIILSSFLNRFDQVKKFKIGMKWKIA